MVALLQHQPDLEAHWTALGVERWNDVRQYAR